MSEGLSKCKLQITDKLSLGNELIESVTFHEGFSFRKSAALQQNMENLGLRAVEYQMWPNGTLDEVGHKFLLGERLGLIYELFILHFKTLKFY